MTNHTKLTPEQYAQIQAQQTVPYGTKMTPQDEAIHAGMVTRHRPAHNFPIESRGMSHKEMVAEIEDMLRPIVKEVKQLRFTNSALNTMATEQRNFINDLVARLDKLEASPKRSNLTNLVLEEQAGEDMRMRNLLNNKREVAE